MDEFRVMTKKDYQNLLFICSPTAETMWRKHAFFHVRSAGTSPNARKTVSVADIRWADVIFVMENKHKNRLLAKFTRLLKHKPVHVLDIPDDYQYMDEDLIEELDNKVNALLNPESEK